MVIEGWEVEMRPLDVWMRVWFKSKKSVFGEMKSISQTYTSRAMHHRNKMNFLFVSVRYENMHRPVYSFPSPIAMRHFKYNTGLPSHQDEEKYKSHLRL